MKKLIYFLTILSFTSMFGQSKSKNGTSSQGEVIFTNKPYKNFAEAKPNAVSKVKDGDPLYVYLKTTDPLSNHTIKENRDGSVVYFINIAIGAEGDPTQYDYNSFMFSKQEVDALGNELMVNLAPGSAGKNKSFNLFLKALGEGDPGLWKNEIRFNNDPNTTDPKSFAKGLILCDVQEGIAKYQKLYQNFKYVQEHGNKEDNEVPPKGAFTDAKLLAEAAAKIKAKGIIPHKLYFFLDDWKVYTNNNNEKQSRTVYGLYTYKKGNECYKGVIDITQDYAWATASWAAVNITLRDDFPIMCDKY